MSVVDAGETVDSFASTLGEDPLLAVAVAVVSILVLAGAGLLLRRLLRPPGKRFARVVKQHDSLAVLMHPNPDPDAMACALAVEEIAADYETDTSLYYSGQIRHHENRAFKTVLEADFECIDEGSDIRESEVVLVDHNEPRGFPGTAAIEPTAVVDHHPGDGTGAAFTDVRTDYGACATIFTEYVQQLGKQAVNPDEVDGDGGETHLSPRLASALIYGIQSDTNQLTKGCSAAEFEAAAFLYDGVDPDTLDRIANPDMDPETLDVKARAITDREVRSAFAVSDVGTVSNVDAIPQAADELRRLEGINAVVVLAQKNETIHLSGRSNDDRVHMGEVLEAVVEDIPMASGGGHSRMGGGQCPLEHMEGLGPGEGVSRDELKERLFAAMNGDL